MDTAAQRERSVETQGEDSHLQAREAGLGQILPWSLCGKRGPADTLIQNHLLF